MLEKFLRLSEVRNRVPCSRATICRLISSGELPRPYSLGARALLLGVRPRLAPGLKPG